MGGGNRGPASGVRGAGGGAGAGSALSDGWRRRFDIEDVLRDMGGARDAEQLSALQLREEVGAGGGARVRCAG